MSDIRGTVNDSTLYAGAEGNLMGLTATKRGELVVVDWLTSQAMRGRAYQNRAGTITTPITADVLITDTAAEMATSSAAGTTIIPIYLNCHIEALGGTLPEIAAKSVGAVHTAQTTVVVALPLKIGGAAAVSTSGVGTAGGVTVAAEVVTTTRRHFANIAAVAAETVQIADHHFMLPPVLVGPACFYVQIGSVTTGSTYMASYDFIELPTVNV